MLVVALTGGIASGKTTVSKILAKHFPVIDCDEIVSQLYKKKTICAKLEKEFFTCNKKILSRMIFAEPKEGTCFAIANKKKLERIFHPLVLREVKSQLKKFKKANKKIVFIDVPLLFETFFKEEFPLSVCIYCTKAQQVARLKKKGISKQEALQRIKAQIPLKEKIKYSDFVIDNSKTLGETKKQIKELIKDLEERI